jgi:membrane protein implicated in regulation of membrane protease activity
MRKLRWSGPDRSLPKRPYRDTAIFYAVLAAVVVVVAAATGGDIVKAVIVALAFFLIATAFSWWRWRERLRAKERQP